MNWVSNTRIGDNIEAAMRSRGVDLKQLAGASGVHHCSIVRIARGDYGPKLDTIQALASALRCEDWELLKPGCFDD